MCSLKEAFRNCPSDYFKGSAKEEDRVRGEVVMATGAGPVSLAGCRFGRVKDETFRFAG
jgi:hypothetical protein